MNYEKHYNTLIERSKGRILEGYTERHHIIPKCMGGSNDDSNIAVLTPEEHFVAHQLLVKMFPKNFKLAFALSMMCVASSRHQRNNKRYGWIRKSKANAHSKAPRKARKKETKPRNRDYTMTEDHRSKIKASSKGKKLSEEHKAKIKESQKGKTLSAEHRAKIKKSWVKRKSKIV